MSQTKLNKALYENITRLKLLDKPTANVRFRLRHSPFSDDDDDNNSNLLSAQSENTCVIIGDVFPKSKVYNQRAFSIKMKLTNAFPMDPSEIRFLTPIYHPNVDKDGKFCNQLLQKYAKWLPTTPLEDVIKITVAHIDNSDIQYAVSLELVQEYSERREEFDRKALEHTLKHALSF